MSKRLNNFGEVSGFWVPFFGCEQETTAFFWECLTIVGVSLFEGPLLGC